MTPECVVQIASQDVTGVYSRRQRSGQLSIPPHASVVRRPFAIGRTLQVLDWSSYGMMDLCELSWLHGLRLRFTRPFLYLHKRINTSTSDVPPDTLLSGLLLVGTLVDYAEHATLESSAGRILYLPCPESRRCLEAHTCCIVVPHHVLPYVSKQALVETLLLEV